MRVFDGFAAATAFLTRVPVAPTAREFRLSEAGWAFPLVGAGIGLLAAAVLALAQLLRLGDWPSALLAILAGAVLSGGLHEDGLADTADGFGGGRDRIDKLRIMRDSRHGTYGVLSIVLSVLLRAAALAEIGDPIHAGLALVAAHAASRGLLPPAMIWLPPARADGLGAEAGRPPTGVALVAVVLGAAMAAAALGPASGAAALGLAAAAVAISAVLAYRQIGGYTGDVLGAFQQVGEIAMLLAAAAR